MACYQIWPVFLNFFVRKFLLLVFTIVYLYVFYVIETIKHKKRFYSLRGKGAPKKKGF